MSENTKQQPLDQGQIQALLDLLATTQQAPVSALEGLAKRLGELSAAQAVAQVEMGAFQRKLDETLRQMERDKQTNEALRAKKEARMQGALAGAIGAITLVMALKELIQEPKKDK